MINFSKKIMTKNTLIFLFSLSLLSIRPALFGESYSAVATFLIFGSAFCFYCLFPEGSRLGYLDSINLHTLIPFIGIEAVQIMNSVLRGTDLYNPLVQIIPDVLIVIPSYYLLSHHEVNWKVSKMLYYFILAMSISTIITAILSFVINPSELILFKFRNAKTYVGMDMGLLFPFTLAIQLNSSPSDKIFGVPLYRTLNFLREPGIGQAFIAWAVIVTREFFKKDINVAIFRSMLLIALILTFSSTGPISIAICLLYLLFFEKAFVSKYIGKFLRIRISRRYIKYVFLFLVVLFLLIFILELSSNRGFINDLWLNLNNLLSQNSDSNLNVSKKLSPSGASWGDRDSQITPALEQFLKHPLAIEPVDPILEVSAINLLAILDTIGIQGLICIVCIYFAYILKGSNLENKIFYAFSILPIFVTALFTQPIIVTPLVMVLLLFNFRTIRFQK